MTTKDFSSRYAWEMSVVWLGESMANAGREDWGEADNRAPDRLAETNPDDETTRWEWDEDLTTEEDALFDSKYKVVSGGGGAGPTETEVDEAIDQVQQFINRTQDPTDAQRDATIDAVATILKHFWAR